MTALACLDVHDRLHEMAAPVLTVAGSDDVATPTEHLEQIVAGVQRGRLVVLDGVGHLAPAEAPSMVAKLVSQHFESAPAPAAVPGHRRHHPFTQDFQELINRYAWGTVWTRPGLDRRSRSMITLTALIARGHHEELALHVRAARRNGLSDEEIREVILQCAIYCGVPGANTAFRVAQQVLAELGTQPTKEPKP